MIFAFNYTYNVYIKEQLHTFSTNIVNHITNRLQRFWESWICASPPSPLADFVFHLLSDPERHLGLGVNQKPILIDWYLKGCRIRVMWGIVEIEGEVKILEKSWFVKWDPQQNQAFIIKEGLFLCTEFK